MPDEIAERGSILGGDIEDAYGDRATMIPSACREVRDVLRSRIGRSSEIAGVASNDLAELVNGRSVSRAPKSH